MAVEFASRDISAKYDRFARWYDWLEGIPNLLGLSKLRRMLLRRASGKVLEVAVGTGKNLSYYPPDCRIVAVDLSKGNVKRSAKASSGLLHACFLLARGRGGSGFSGQEFRHRSLLSFDVYISQSRGCA